MVIFIFLLCCCFMTYALSSLEFLFNQYLLIAARFDTEKGELKLYYRYMEPQVWAVTDRIKLDVWNPIHHCNCSLVTQSIVSPSVCPSIYPSIFFLYDYIISEQINTEQHGQHYFDFFFFCAVFWQDTIHRLFEKVFSRIYQKKVHPSIRPSSQTDRQPVCSLYSQSGLWIGL